MAPASDLAPFRREGDRFVLSIPAEAREVLRRLAGQYRELLREEDPSSDPGVARLFPPALEDDPLANLEYERVAHDGLLAERLRNIDTLERTADAESLTPDEVTAWLTLANDLRLVLGTRLGVTEETEPTDFADDPDGRETYEVFAFLTGVVAAIVEALGEP